MATTAPEKTPQQAFNQKIARLAEPPPPVLGPTEVREGLPYEALETLSRTLGLTQHVLTQVLDVSERTLQRRHRTGRLSPSESDRLWRIAHIHRLALEAFDGREEEARQWLTSPVAALGGETPIEHLDTEPGLRVVEQMLSVIEYTMPA